MDKISRYTIIYFFNKIKAEKFIAKNNLMFPFLNSKIYVCLTIFKVVLLIVALQILMTLFIFEVIPVAIGYWFITILYLIYFFLVPSLIQSDDQQYHFLDYFHSGLFSRKQIERNNTLISFYYSLFTGLVFLVLSICFQLVLFKINQFKIVDLGLNIIWIIAVFVSVYIRCITVLNKKGEKSKNNYSAYVNYLLLFFVYKMMNLGKLIGYIGITELQNINFSILMLVSVLFTSLVLMKSLFYKRRFSGRQSFIDIWMSKKNMIVKDFYFSEVINKYYVLLILSTILVSITMSSLKKNSLLSVIIFFLFSQYNQRYLLNLKFVSYLKMINNTRAVLTIILKKLLYLQVSIVIFSTMLINSNMLSILLFSAFNLTIFSLNLLISTFIYYFIFRSKFNDNDKLRYIEVIFFIPISLQIALVFIGGM